MGNWNKGIVYQCQKDEAEIVCRLRVDKKITIIINHNKLNKLK